MQFHLHKRYLDVIQIELFKLGIIVLKLLKAGVNIGAVWRFILVHLKVGVLCDA